MFNLACFIFFTGLVLRQYLRSYEQGLLWTTFLIVILPDSVGLDLNEALPMISASRVMIVLTIVFWLKNRSAPAAIKTVPFYKIQILIAACFLVSTFLSPYPLVSIKRYFYYLLESFILFYVIQDSLIDARFTQKIIDAIGYGLLIVALLGFSERYLGFNPFEEGQGGRYAGGAERMSWALGGDAGIQATYKHRILFGVACAIGSLKFLLDSALRPQAAGVRKSLFLSFICGSALYYSGSRGPWLAFMVGAVLLIVLLPRFFLKRALILGIIVCLVLVARPGVWTSISGLSEATTNAESVRGASFEWRSIVWKTAVTKISQSDPLHFLFGYGGGSTIMTDFGRVELSSGMMLPLQSWDCEAAIILYERGFLGLIFILILYSSALFVAITFLFQRRAEPDPAMAFACSSLMVMAFMMTNVAIFAPQLTFITAYVLGIASKILSSHNVDEFKHAPLPYAA